MFGIFTGSRRKAAGYVFACLAGALTITEAQATDVTTQYPGLYCRHEWTNPQGSGGQFNPIDVWTISSGLGAGQVRAVEYAQYGNGGIYYHSTGHANPPDIQVICPIPRTKFGPTSGLRSISVRAQDPIGSSATACEFRQIVSEGTGTGVSYSSGFTLLPVQGSANVQDIVLTVPSVATDNPGTSYEIYCFLGRGAELSAYTVVEKD
jgi:hypothetical protein